MQRSIILKAKQVISLSAILLIAGLLVFLKWAGPYGPEYLDQWIDKGTIIVKAIEEYKDKNGSYPQTLPIKIDPTDIPGCKKIEYQKFTQDNTTEYFTIRMIIHLREVVIYDSRKNLDSSSSWGDYKIIDDWMWTKD